MENQRRKSVDVMDDSDAAADDTDATTPSDSDQADVGCGSVSSAAKPTRPRILDRIGGWPGIAAGVAAVLFIGSVVFAGSALQPYLADRADAGNRLEVARNAAAAVTSLWTYTPDTIDGLAERTSAYLTDEFGGQYRKFAESIALPNKRAQITDKTEVVGVAVESLNGDDAVAMVFTNTTATSPLSQNVPSLKYIAYRLELKREQSRWRVNKMSTVSFIDLTPQL
ncbi:conserved hypothetical protein [uncultured Mycobacterium sp.]|uniref:Mammalian cell entry protein n=1 Tax=uncultured Mycobacterium sp. TaxID=171292 RepID=A0A1Y5PUU0_9MYCO|nr:conserved hypothetical protein [uncultured Mycobacterium sp.]